MTEAEPNPWADIVGPCYTAASLARKLGWFVGEVRDAAATLAVLELETEEGTLLYPAFQIRKGRVLDGLGAVLQVLSTGTDSSWTWVQWLNTSVDDETGEPAPSAIAQLRDGLFDEVLRDARHSAAAWSS